jgi:hypothetical protein
MPAFACSEEPTSTTVVPYKHSSVAVNDLNSKLCSFVHDCLCYGEQVVDISSAMPLEDVTFALCAG